VIYTLAGVANRTQGWGLEPTIRSARNAI
jgi:hypothetical protein